MDSRILLPSTTDDIIFDALPPAALYRYARVCRASRDAVQSYIGRTFTIQKVLGRYFSENEICEFRRLQYDTGMLISGSTALQFFNRELYDDSDLDIYVDHRYGGDIAFWLQDIGYQYVPLFRNLMSTLEQALVGMDPQSRASPYWDAKLVINFIKRSPERKIQLITTDLSPMHLVLKFHSSCVMNIITHNKAYSLFPQATFDGRNKRSLVNMTCHKTAQAHKCLEKYAQRGWKILDIATRRDVEPSNDTFLPELRRVGDRKCWTLPILPEMGFPDQNPIQSNAWTMEYDGLLRPNLLFNSISPEDTLKFGYVCPPSESLIACIDEILYKADPDRHEGRYRNSEKYDNSYAALLKWYLDLHSV